MCKEINNWNQILAKYKKFYKIFIKFWKLDVKSHKSDIISIKGKKSRNVHYFYMYMIRMFSTENRKKETSDDFNKHTRYKSFKKFLFIFLSASFSCLLKNICLYFHFLFIFLICKLRFYVIWINLLKEFLIFFIFLLFLFICLLFVVI